MLVAVFVWWSILALVAAGRGWALAQVWPGWSFAFAAAGAWGLILLVLVYGVGPPFNVSRPPVLAASFGFVMTLFGTGSYWATIQLYPAYRVGIERAAWLVAICTVVAVMTAAISQRLLRGRRRNRLHLEWEWPRVAAVTYLIFALAAAGTFVSINRIGYIPIFRGDPTSARVDFPDVGGVWYRLSMLGGVVALLVAAQAAAGRATLGQYMVGLASLALVGVYGPRFFVVLPLGVGFLLWDRVRAHLKLGRVVLLVAIVAPILAFVGYWREQNQNVVLLSPLGLLLYGTLGEFRDLGWALDYFDSGERFLHGRTLGSLIVPLLPTPVWKVLGIDKMAIYSQNSARILADAMGQVPGQRIGAYGEFFIEFGWVGALVGAALYGVVLGYLDARYRRVDRNEVRGIMLALAIATTVFAQIGQLNMYTSTLTGYGYPLALVVMLAARRRAVITHAA